MSFNEKLREKYVEFKKVKNNPKVSFHKVKAHSGNKMNERADKLAKKMAYQEY